MARPLRIEYAGAWYHVTCRGNEKRPIFRDDKDRRGFVSKLTESLNLHSVQLHCYVLMPNHFHLVIKTLAANLSRFMQRFNTAYSIYFNLRHDRKGHLYQGRFKGILIEADEYLLELSRYIHLNPVRTKQCEHMPIGQKLGILKKYRWSSYHGYVSRARQVPFVCYDQILDYMGGNTVDGRKRYREFVIAGLHGKLQNPLEDARGGLILGSKHFLEWVEENFIAPLEPDKDVVNLSRITAPIPVRSIAEVVAREYGYSAESLIRKSAPNSALHEARQLLVELCYRLNGGRLSLRDLGRELGGISGSQIGRVHRLINERITRNSQLRGRISRLIQDYFAH